MGCVVIDVDQLGHVLLMRPSIKKKIHNTFGNSIVDTEGNINRKKLGDAVFRSERARCRLNAIMHPPLIKMVKEQIEKNKRNVVVVNAALLIEMGLHHFVEKIVCVQTKKSILYQRAVYRNKLTRTQIKKRLAAQLSSHEKAHYADYCIRNDHSISHTRQQVYRVWYKIQLRYNNDEL